jgi:hypothetical protein
MREEKLVPLELVNALRERRAERSRQWRMGKDGEWRVASGKKPRMANSEWRMVRCKTGGRRWCAIRPIGPIRLIRLMLALLHGRLPA